MGIVKSAWMADQDRGFSCDPDLRVCLDCFEDPALCRAIADLEQVGTCSFCMGTPTSVADLEYVMEIILGGMSTEWGDPACEGLPYESREGGWQGAIYDTREVLECAGLETGTQDLFDVVVGNIHNTLWCERDPYSLSKNESLYFGWSSFCEYVCSEARYTFLRASPSWYDAHQRDEIDPVSILQRLAEVVGEFGLVCELPAATPMFRARVVSDECTSLSAMQLGSPPVDQAIMSNRMSPAGVPMFYAALDVDTAISETFDLTKSKGKVVILGEFISRQSLRLLDLTKTLPVPSLFDLGGSQERQVKIFWRNFVRDFAKPITRDDRSHVDYVPTQVVTEYFRYLYKHHIGGSSARLDGVLYRSTKRPEGIALVVFANNSQCGDKGSGALLELVSTTRHDPAGQS